MKELRDLLAAHDDDDLVIIQKDSEGNDFSPLRDVWDGSYIPDTTWSGGGYPRHYDGTNALFLVPID